MVCLRLIGLFCSGMTAQKYYVLCIGAGILSVTFLFSYMGVFSIPNALLYDTYVSYSPAYGKNRPKVLLIDVSHKQQRAGDEQWLKLLTMLKELDARQISFTFFPENTSNRFYHETVNMGNVLFAQKAIMSSSNLFKETLIPLPESAQETGVKTAVSILRASSYGMYRSQFASVLINDQRFNTLETEVVKQFYGRASTIQDESFFVDFMGGAGRLPIITLDKVFAGDLVPELVANRSIIIGSTEFEGITVSAPVLDNGGIISSLAFHGFALETLLSDRVIHQSNLVVVFILVIFAISISLLIYQRLGIKLSSWLTIAIFIFYMVMAWFLLVYVHVWQPISELGFAQLVTFLAFLHRRITQDNLVLRQVLLEASTKMRERVSLPSFYESQDPWSQVVAMINQVLDLNRIILLDRVIADHRVKEVKALNCSLEDINEMRRDYERTPYSTAIERNGPIIVTKYLQEVDYDEIQYLVPLVYSGEVLGFWSFGILSEKVATQPNFEAIVNDFALQIAELLHYRRQWLSRQVSGVNKVRRYLQLEGGEQDIGELNKTVAMVEMRLTNLEDFLDALTSAAIIYDLFGRVMLANDAMERLLEDFDYASKDMTALDLITQLSGMDTGKVRGFIEQVVVDRKATIMPISVLGSTGKIYILHISPLLLNGSQRNIDTETSAPFNLSGILCEMIDISTVKQLCDMKDNLLQHISNQFQKNISSIQAISASICELIDTPTTKQQCSMEDNLLQRISNQFKKNISSIQATSASVSSENLSKETLRQSIGELNEKIANVALFIQQSQSYLKVDLWGHTDESYPVDARESIEKAIASQNSAAELREIELKHNLAELMILALADKYELIKLFDAILHILIQDAAENTTVFVNYEKHDDLITLTFSNSGFGMPNERFQQYLLGNENVTSQEFRKLRCLLLNVQKWGGALNGYSEVGLGIHFTIKLRSFN